MHATRKRRQSGETPNMTPFLVNLKLTMASSGSYWKAELTLVNLQQQIFCVLLLLCWKLPCSLTPAA
jgi:hypothetical protein